MLRAQTIINTLRHAHTRYNEERRYAGTLDVGLSRTGVQEAEKASQRLADRTFDVVITSTLKRTFETARIIVGGKVAIVKTRLCDERNFGIMEGLTWNEVQTLQPPVLLIDVGGDQHTVNPKGGEPFEDVWERAKKFRRFVFNHYEGASILVISHGVFLQMFHGLLRGLNCIESLAVYPANLELATFEFSSRRLVKEQVIKLAERDVVRW